MKRVSTITALAIIGIIALIVYASPWTEMDVVPKGYGEGVDLQAWIALGTGVLSLAASTIGLLMKLIELRERRGPKADDRQTMHRMGCWLVVLLCIATALPSHAQ